MFRTSVLFMMIVFMVSCGQNKKGQQEIPAGSEQAPEVSAPKGNHPGKQVYNAVCLACHMADGTGIDGINPPVVSSDFVNGDPAALITLVLEGKSGKRIINGKEYNGIMPPHRHLSDKQIADVLTYIRGSFGNNSAEITKEQVQQIRNKN